MRTRSIVTSVLAFLLLALGVPATAQAQPGTGSLSNSVCTPGTPDNAPATTSYYDPNRTFLGPEPLPSTPPVGPLLAGYKRFGDLTEAAFIAKYRNDSGWIYPDHDGFTTIGGQPVKYPMPLLPGRRVDRFGYPGGKFLAPAKDTFAARSLPPSNLNTPAGTPQANYHLYCVLKPFAVDAGPIAPWFAQPGGGTQYVLSTTYLPQAGPAIGVTWLLQNGYLVEERP